MSKKDPTWCLYNYKSWDWYELRHGILYYQGEKSLGKAKGMGYFVIIY